MLDIIFRRTIRDDLAQLPDLYKEGSDKNTNIDLMYKSFDKLSNNDDYLFYSAVLLNGELVGFMSVIINHDIVEESRDFATIWNVRTKELYRQQKVAKRLFTYAEAELKNRNIDFICLLANLDNFPAQRLYESLGFAEEKGYFKKI